MFRCILCALKFSNAGIIAFEKAAQIARIHRAKLYVFHALDYRLSGVEPDDPDITALKRSTEKRFDEEIRQPAGLIDPTSFICVPADPAMAVCKMARELSVDLIVLGCHQPLEKVGLGRIDYVGMTILEKAPCPVMLIPYFG